ncbi:MAG: hypothetical protein KIS77_16910 [Saprospiraceae bacterium]|nr:hypothetical protein [Saprospiraceae bacterium]
MTKQNLRLNPYILLTSIFFLSYCNNALGPGWLSDSRGCWVRLDPKKPKCTNVGDIPVRVKDEYCEEGYLRQYDCPTCRGEKTVRKNVGTDPYRNVIYYQCVTCPDCCGVGRMVHTYCNGKGWAWECQSSNP